MLAKPGSVAAVDGGPGHRDRAVESGLRRGATDTGGGELRLMVDCARVSMPTSGWIVGTARETLAMSVEKVGGGAPASSAGYLRPSDSALRRQEADERRVRHHVRVGRRDVVDLEVASGSERPGLEAAVDPRAELLQVPSESARGA